jgi:tRNA A37 threonylcarbamoyladenosine modification protein TsaB
MLMKTPEKYKVLIDTADRNNRVVTLLKLGDGDQKEMERCVGQIDVVVTIKSVLDKHKLIPSDISEFVANPGPGSFTGLKIGVTVSNTLNWVLGRKRVDELVAPVYGAEPNIS